MILRVKTEKKYETRKFVNIFQNSMWKQEYALEFDNRFEMLESMEAEDNIDNNNNEKWGNIKTIIKETKQKLKEKSESTETIKRDGMMRHAKLQQEK